MTKFFDSKNIYIIAEIGVNHNGDIQTAKDLINAAVKAGADAVKFQSFTAANLVTTDAPKVEYQKRNSHSSESHFEMLSRLQLTVDDHLELFNYCNSLGISFISTPYDVQWATYLVEELGCTTIKTASADLIDLELHNYLSNCNVDVIIATGMATLGEIEETLTLYKAGCTNSVTLLQCTSNYPCSDESVNLRMIEKLEKTFGYPSGFSDHSLGHTAAIAATCLGAIVLEKHFTLDQEHPGPDHKASSNPIQFEEMVTQIRRVEKMMGSGSKKVEDEELQMKNIARKSLHYTRALKKGEVLSSSDFILLRPGHGLRPKNRSELVGRALTQHVAKHQIVEEGHFG